MKKTKEEINQMLSDSTTSTLLFRFAYIGKELDQQKYLTELSALAETESWTSSGGKPHDILMSYITYTFDKAFKDNLIEFSNNNDYCCFNTGLLTNNGEDIICIFNTFTSSQSFSWHLYGFRKESDWDIMKNFSETPEVVSYFDDASKIYFDPKLPVISNLDHILDENLDRFSEELQKKGKTYILALLKASLDITLKKCKRNYRIAVPQYYNDEITYLLPVDLDGCKMALAIGYVNSRYRANTIFTLPMAYKNARLLMKPEADWLEV
ncbi:MAG: DUF3825 domain-containing protein [Anaerorhabdus sp.]|uniref:DUF3825 domain-containing protein n=1 Tax=Anaerorhabdus sp. TaxID=1872524 RepID=UPI003A83A1B1